MRFSIETKKELTRKSLVNSFLEGFRGESNEDTPFLDYFVPAKLL